MKLFIILLLVLATTRAMSEVPLPTIAWNPLASMSHDQGISFYVDVNSLRRTKTVDGDFGYSTILISSKTPYITSVKGVPTTVTSIVKNFLTECSKGLMLQLTDFYFDVELPARADKPIAAFEYNTTAIMNTDKRSPLFKIACPDYI